MQNRNQFEPLSSPVIKAWLRLRPPSALTGTRWTVEAPHQRRSWVLPEAAVFALVKCREAQNGEELMASLCSEMGMRAEQAKSMMEGLYKAELLVDKNSMPAANSGDFSSWPIMGWDESSRFHQSILDYPFFNYSDRVEIQSAKSRMNAYLEQESEVPRSKSYEDALMEISCPEVVDVEIDRGADSVIRRSGLPEPAPGACDQAKIGRLFSLAFGKMSERNLSYQGSDPVITKTSPSGGSRHPTEAYLVAWDFEGMAPGWYHFSADKSAFELVSLGIDMDEIQECFFGPMTKAPFAPRGLAFMTSIFERNMYRYREPRTFRSIHLDVGHLVETMALSCEAMGIKYYTQFANDDQRIESKIRCHGLEEGVMIAVALA